MEGFKTSHRGVFGGLHEGAEAANGDSRQVSALLKAGFTSEHSSAMKRCVRIQSGGVLHRLPFKSESQRREGRRGQHSEHDCTLLMSIWHWLPDSSTTALNMNCFIVSCFLLAIPSILSTFCLAGSASSLRALYIDLIIAGEADLIA